MSAAFKSPGWTHSTNIYEVNLRQYTQEGTFKSFAQHLPGLRDMGIETIWFMPVHPIGLKNRKGGLGSYYSISDHKAIHPGYGTWEDFRWLIEEAHEMGFAIMLDWVANHAAWDHVWTNINPEFFMKDEKGNFRPPYPEWSDVIKLNYDQGEMRQAMIDAMKYWVNECDIDGYRCDMAHLVPLDFWMEARRQVDAVKPLFWLAETEDLNYHEAFDASYTWEFLHMMEKFWQRQTGIGGLDHVLDKYKTDFPKDALRIYFTSNHDENSHSGSEYQRMGDAAKAFAVLCATWNGIPLIYSGQELPNDKALAFFEKDVIEWKEEDVLHEFYKKLLHLRKTNPALHAHEASSAKRLNTSADDKIFSFLRKKGDHEVLVVLNLSPAHLQFSLQEDVEGSFNEIFWGAAKNFTENKNLELGAWQYLVFERLI
jgi:alpha-amylase